MQEVCGIDLKLFFDEYKEPFNCEMTFQFYLALFLQSNLRKKFGENVEIEFESNIYKDKNCRCDIVVKTPDNNVTLIELKYVVEGTDSNKSSYGSRVSFMHDVQRLKDNINIDNVKHKYCIFISNKSGVLMPSEKSKNEAKDFQELYPKSKWIELCWNKPNNNKKNNIFNPFILVEEVK